MKTNQKATILLLTLLIILTTQTIAVTVTGGSSSYSFQVENCTADPNTTLSCGNQIIRFECDIGNPAFIDQVEFRIQGTDYLTTQNSSTPYQFYLYYYKANDTSSTNTPITFDRQSITDVDNRRVNANILVEIPRNCTTCEATFTTQILDYCTTNNTQLVQYTSTNNTCQPSYNTTQACDYCTPNLIANTTSCSLNNTRTTSYEDLNFNTCCQATLFAEDCPTLYYPYSQSVTTTCQYYQNDFLCNMDERPVIDDKINLNCELPEENACCVINVYQNNNGTRTLLQTSPEYKNTANSFFSGSVETRTCFPTTNRLLNAYYTNKELRPDANYEVEVLCTSNTTSYRTTTAISPTYKIYDQPIQRIKWMGDNAGYTVVGIATIIILFALGVFALNKIRGR